MLINHHVLTRGATASCGAARGWTSTGTRRGESRFSDHRPVSSLFSARLHAAGNKPPSSSAATRGFRRRGSMPPRAAVAGGGGAVAPPRRAVVEAERCSWRRGLARRTPRGSDEPGRACSMRREDNGS
ncbi:hypothetical protein HU200_053362 [Digitaria exilis]|uniref:Uncharacterized protein n=1 Tax=Digitaria exilis TaxID=1010633 RepID=A0A835AMD3_9POAL|nr:hypothetical protein HU200_053362 [Digitaria exilis]